LDLARKGAEARLRELRDEAERLFAAFPDLRKSFDRDELPIDFLLQQGARGSKRSAASRRGGKGLSAAGRKAISRAQKARWAKLREKKT